MAEPATTPDDPRLRRLALVDLATLSRLMACSGRTITRMVAVGDFPRPIRFGRRNVRWKLREVENYIGSTPAAPAVKESIS